MTEHSHKLAPDDFIRLKVKAELRKRLRGVRKTTPLEACEVRSAALVARLETHPAMVNARTVALFWPIVSKHEVDLRALDTSLRARGVRIAYPTIDAESNVMTFRFVDVIAQLEEKGFGFSEPAPDAIEATALDVVVVPAIAIDPTGHRIGYGAGYAYDHDAEDGFSGQNYFPEAMKRPVYYTPPERGFERDLKKRIEYFAKLRAKRNDP